MTDDKKEVEETPQPIWGADNKLVDPQLDQHFREQAEIVLGKRSALDKGEEGDEDGVELNTVDLNKPFLSQQMESQTSDPMTSPSPSADPNSRPSELTPMSEETAKLDEELDKAARAMTEAQAKTEEPTPTGATDLATPAQGASDASVTPISRPSGLPSIGAASDASQTGGSQSTPSGGSTTP